jgi:hypothetical protein
MKHVLHNVRRSLIRSAARGGGNKRALASHTTPSIKVPGPSTTTWERSAARVKNTNISNNSYLEAIRDTHDPSMHLKTIEDELKATIGQALKRQGDKIFAAVQRMAQVFAQYEELLQEHETMHHADVQACAERYNEIRKEAIQARWELIVHRQAAGFIVNNHKYIMEHYPISGALPLSEEEAAGQTTTDPEPKKVFGDQLDWWQRIGRWR